jgi:hypothetical protein
MFALKRNLASVVSLTHRSQPLNRKLNRRKNFVRPGGIRETCTLPVLPTSVLISRTEVNMYITITIIIIIIIGARGSVAG